MNYGRIFYNDVANGVGCRTALFVSGCRHHCRGCFNPETWDFSYGEPFTEEIADRIIESLQPEWIDGLTILGGEPMEPENQPEILSLLTRVRSEAPDSTVWIYSGYTFEELISPSHPECHTEDTSNILSLTDILVDGEFVLEKKDISLPFRGSSNQRILDIPASLREGKACRRDPAKLT